MLLHFLQISRPNLLAGGMLRNAQHFPGIWHLTTPAWRIGRFVWRLGRVATSAAGDFSRIHYFRLLSFRFPPGGPPVMRARNCLLGSSSRAAIHLSWILIAVDS